MCMLKNYQEMLEYGFSVLNREFFNGELPPIVITIQSSRGSYGHFTIQKEWRVAEERYNEINISAEHLDRPIENIMSTLMHELVHYYNFLNGVKDTSQYGRYHNKLFKQEAEKRGLIITYRQYIGWSHTEPSPEFIEVLQENGIEKPIDINRDGVFGIGLTGIGGSGTDGTNGATGIAGTEPGKRKCSTRKYICPTCGTSFRATKDINVLCMDCNEQFIKVEK